MDANSDLLLSKLISFQDLSEIELIQIKKLVKRKRLIELLESEEGKNHHNRIRGILKLLYPGWQKIGSKNNIKRVENRHQRANKKKENSYTTVSGGGANSTGKRR